MLPTTLNTEELDMMADVDRVVVRSVAAGDPLIACEYGRFLQRSATMRGIALAKLLFGLRENWALFQAAGTGDTFENFVDAHMEVTSQTANKYANMWKSIFTRTDISEEVKSQLQTKPIKELLLLVAAVDDGSIGEQELREAIIKSHGEIREMVQGARGTQTSSRTAVRIVLVTRDGGFYPAGTLLATQEGQEAEIIGTLNLEPNTSHGAKAIARLRNSETAGILER